MPRKPSSRSTRQRVASKRNVAQSTSNDRPKFRAPKVLTDRKFLSILSRGSAENIHLALIDGSRCLDEQTVYPHAVRLLQHRSAKIRWGACFALGFRVDAVARGLACDGQVVHTLGRVASHDKDAGVRNMASQVLTDLAFHLHSMFTPGRPARLDLAPSGVTAQ